MTHKTDQIESAQTELSTASDVEQRERMRLLITDLVKTNQELRFREAQLKETIARLEKGQRDEVPWAGMLI
jgi:cell division protein FtsB